jgi:hypothetical protein
MKFPKGVPFPQAVVETIIKLRLGISLSRSKSDTCTLCGEAVIVTPQHGTRDPLDYEAHHIKSRSVQGSDLWYNRIDLCYRCHGITEGAFYADFPITQEVLNKALHSIRNMRISHIAAWVKIEKGLDLNIEDDRAIDEFADEYLENFQTETPLRAYRSWGIYHGFTRYKDNGVKATFVMNEDEFEGFKKFFLPTEKIGFLFMEEAEQEFCDHFGDPIRLFKKDKDGNYEPTREAKLLDSSGRLRDGEGLSERSVESLGEASSFLTGISEYSGRKAG